MFDLSDISQTRTLGEKILVRYVEISIPHVFHHLLSVSFLWNNFRIEFLVNGSFKINLFLILKRFFHIKSFLWFL